MPVAPLEIDGLLDPISAGQPAGADLRWTPEWDRIKEARRADDKLPSGGWARREQKTADWPMVRQLGATLLREQSKDLQLAMWLTEAGIKLDGFRGLGDGLRLARELILRYWDQGLYPPIETGPEDRAGPLQWLNDKLVDSITAIPITRRADGGRDYSVVDLEDARRVGAQSRFRDKDGEVIDEKKKKEYDAALADGHISMEMYERAVKETRRAEYEEFAAEFRQAYDEFKALEKVIDEKFGEAAPNLAACRNALNDIQQAVSDIVEQKRKEEPDAPRPATSAVGSSQVSTERTQPTPDQPAVVRFPLALSSVPGQPGPGGSWQEAELLIRSGEVDRGLAEMTRLAANETSGRSRFQRKLLLAEVCLATKRERLARSILEELAEQIDKFQLEFWESSELIGSVWTRLYKLYRQSGPGTPDAERAGKLYERLCRLDPWQALGCSEG